MLFPWLLLEWNIRIHQNLKYIYKIWIFSIKYLVLQAQTNLICIPPLLFLGRNLFAFFPLDSSLSFKKRNGLKGLEHRILHICLLLQSNMKSQGSFHLLLLNLKSKSSCLFWCHFGSAPDWHPIVSAVMSSLPWTSLFGVIFFCISQRISSFHCEVYICVKLLGIWNLSSKSFYILLCIFFQMTCCQNFINLFII
jgi:hypothetical protein